LRGRRSARGGRTTDQGGAPWWHGACCGVGGVGERSEQAATGEVLAEEEGGEEIPWPVFDSKRCGQTLGVEAARGLGAPFGPVGQLGAARRRWGMVGEAAAGAEQSSRECDWTREGKSKVGDGSLGSGAVLRSGQPTWAATTGSHRR
jgi:hypothetical protein